MKARYIAIAFALAATPAVAQIQTAQDLQRCGRDPHSQRQCEIYISGVAAGLNLANRICLRPGTLPVDEAKVVEQYVHNRPGRAGQDVIHAIYDALQYSYPCR